MKKKFLFSANRENILKMKVKLVFVALMLSLSFSYASNYSQGKMSVKLTNVKLLKVLDYIEDNSSYRFMYTKKEIALDSKMSISIENAGIKSVLDVVFKNTNISYSLLGNQIILNKIQKTTLRGTVYDAYDQPMFGVNVIINNSTGTTTDFDGNYEVIVKAGDIIEFSYLGYKSKKITYSGQETLNVILEEGISMYRTMFFAILMCGIGFTVIDLVTLFSEGSLQENIDPVSGEKGSKISICDC